MAHRFEDVVEAESADLLRYAAALCGNADQAGDLVAEVLARAYTKWSRVGSTDRPGAYLMRMVTNEFLSWRRRWHTRSVLPSDDEALERAAAPGEDPGTAVVERQDMERRLAALPRRQQVALVLRFYEGLDYAEASAVMGCAEGTVRSACSRGLAALRIAEDDPGTARPAVLTTPASAKETS